MKKGLYAIVTILVIALVWFVVIESKSNDSDKNLTDGGAVATTTVEAVTATSSSVKSETINKDNNKKMNTEQVSKAGDTLTVNYVGTLEDGTKFDSSIDRGVPFTFTVGIGQVIRGWDEGMVGMKVGEKKHLVIPGEKAYGARGIPDGKGGYMIPPNATLIFEVELLGIKTN